MFLKKQLLSTIRLHLCISYILCIFCGFKQKCRTLTHKSCEYFGKKINFLEKKKTFWKKKKNFFGNFFFFGKKIFFFFLEKNQLFEKVNFLIFFNILQIFQHYGKFSTFWKNFNFLEKF